MIHLRNTLVDDYEYISKLDDSLDRPPEGADGSAVEAFEEKWRLYRDGMGDPPLKDGAEPTFFKLRHLRSSERIAIFEIGQAEGGAIPLAARFALVGIRGYAVNGKPAEVKFETLRHAGHRFRVAAMDSMDQLPEVIQVELGDVALKRMTPSTP